MSAEFQTIAALVIVAVAAIWLIVRPFAKRKASGCGSDCGCASTELKAKLKR